MPQREIEALLLEVDRSGRGELELEDFTQLMVLTLSRKAAHAGDHARMPGRKQGGKPGMQQAFLPFEVVALAYRRYAIAAASPAQSQLTVCCGRRRPGMRVRQCCKVTRGRRRALPGRPNLPQNILHGRCSFSTGIWCAEASQLLT